MRGALVWVVWLLSACTRNETLDEAELTPGQGLGPVRLGMTRAELVQAGLVVRFDPSGQGGDQASFAGPFTVIFDPSEHVESVALDLNKVRRGVRVDGIWIEPRASYERAREVLGPCEAPRPFEAGTTTSCRGGQLVIEKSQNEHAPLRIRVLRGDVKPASAP